MRVCALHISAKTTGLSETNFEAQGSNFDVCFKYLVDNYVSPPTPRFNTFLIELSISKKNWVVSAPSRPIFKKLEVIKYHP